MKIELWEVDRIKPYERNPRQNDQAVEAVARSIKEFGFLQPIVVDANRVIIAGHVRWNAARKLGLKRVPVVVAKDMPPEKVKAYRIADNQTARLADWDYEVLPIEIGELQAAGVAVDILAFSEEELDAILGQQDVEVSDADSIFGEPPESVRRNVEELQDIRAVRAKGKAKVMEDGDTEKYLIVVYPNRDAKQKVLKSLGLPEDERYISGDSVRLIRIRKAVPISIQTEGRAKSGEKHHSGACG